MSIMIKLYSWLTYIFYPLVYVYLLYRKSKGKEDKLRFKERLGYPSIKRPEGYLIWIHAASVGESLAVLPLINQLHADYPNITILLTTGTVTSANIIKNRLPATVLHQYVIVDVIQAVKRFLSYWRPDLVLWTESELWPNIITSVAADTTILLVNARISKNSYNKWLRWRQVSSFILQKFSLILPQGRPDAERYRNLGADKIEYIGNLKYSSPPLAVEKEKLVSLQSMMVGRRVFVAASTHHDEEEKIAQLHITLRKQFPNLLTIIVPRHINRSADIRNSMAKLAVKVATRSCNEVIEAATDIYLADTMSELGLFYYLAEIAFIGGTLVARGGHNPIEAAHHNCAIIMGPHIFNFTEICEEFQEHQAIWLVKDEQELAKSISELLTDKTRLDSSSDAAKTFVSGANNILSKTIARISQYMAYKS